MANILELRIPLEAAVNAEEVQRAHGAAGDGSKKQKMEVDGPGCGGGAGVWLYDYYSCHYISNMVMINFYSCNSILCTVILIITIRFVFIFNCFISPLVLFVLLHHQQQPRRQKKTYD
jgi:hypothetical protein